MRSIRLWTVWCQSRSIFKTEGERSGLPSRYGRANQQAAGETENGRISHLGRIRVGNADGRRSNMTVRTCRPVDTVVSRQSQTTNTAIQTAPTYQIRSFDHRCYHPTTDRSWWTSVSPLRLQAADANSPPTSLATQPHHYPCRSTETRTQHAFRITASAVTTSGSICSATATRTTCAKSRAEAGCPDRLCLLRGSVLPGQVVRKLRSDPSRYARGGAGDLAR